MFIPPMLCSRLTDLGRLEDPRYMAEPKLDGQRAQLHIAAGRIVRCYSRRSRDLLGQPGLSWLRELRWPVGSTVLDGELCAGNGMDGIASVFEARSAADGATAFLAFDLLRLEQRDLIREPWEHGRKQLESLLADPLSPKIGLVLVTDDAQALWTTWFEWGGEGIILKDRRAPYRPGLRSPEWLKHKLRLTLEVRVEGGDPELVQWGDWGWAAQLHLTYTHPRTGSPATIDEIVRVRQPDSFALKPGRAAELLCWGVMPSGRLRHPVFLGWR